MTTEKQEKIALFRYGIIFPLLDERLERGEKEKLLEGITARSYEIPFSARTVIARGTVLGWLRQYKKGKSVDALQPKIRKDNGSTRALTEIGAADLRKLRKEHPETPLTVLVRNAQRDGVIAARGKIPMSSVYRMFREWEETPETEKDRRRFEMESCNDLWMLDAMTGPLVTHVFNMLRDFSSRCRSLLPTIRNYLSKCQVKGVDETGMRTAGKLHWLHTVCDHKATYLYADEKRGFAAISRDGLLVDASGSLVHDCWSSYFSLKHMSHAICLQHIQRELRAGITREGKEHEGYFKAFEDLLLEMREAKLNAIERGENSLSEKEMTGFRKRYRMMVDKGFSLFPKPKRRFRLKVGKSPEGKTRSLLTRLRELEDCVFLFLEDFEVPFTNNESERSVRGAKVRQSVSKCFRTKAGLDMFACITSVLDTATKIGITKDRMIDAVYDGTAQALLSAKLV